MQRRFFLVILILAIGVTPFEAGAPPQLAPQQSPATPALPQSPRPGLSVVVLDPAHGGADNGARGESGVVEGEVVLSLARVLADELARQGWQIVWTRQGNDNPSFDDRSAVGNARRGAVFISLHISSTGPVGTARVYSYPPLPTIAGGPPRARPALPSWDEAQQLFVDTSRRLAELVQIELAQKLRGSPEIPAAVPVRQLRTVAAPAIAIELSSVSVPDRKPLDQMAQPLAEAVSRALVAFRTVYPAGAN